MNKKKSFLFVTKISFKIILTLKRIQFTIKILKGKETMKKLRIKITFIEMMKPMKKYFNHEYLICFIDFSIYLTKNILSSDVEFIYFLYLRSSIQQLKATHLIFSQTILAQITH